VAESKRFAWTNRHTNSMPQTIYLGGRVMVFDMDTFKFKRGWGAYGHKLSEITVDDKDREYTPNGSMPKEFRATSR